MQAAFENNGATTPEFRAAILGELVRLISVQMQIVPYGEALAHIMKVSNCTEEQVSGEVIRAWFLLDKLKLIDTNTFAEIKAGTVAIPSRHVIDYIWEDPVWVYDNGTGDAE